MFMPNSPSPPKGIAKREGLTNVAHVLKSDPSSYHRGARELGRLGLRFATGLGGLGP
jgi:hypothetical protein